VVALYAMLIAVANKLQTAAARADEGLAEKQHFLTLSRALDGSNVRIELFTGRTKRAATTVGGFERGPNPHRRRHAGAFAGRHRIRNLGLVVVDEQTS